MSAQAAYAHGAQSAPAAAASRSRAGPMVGISQ